MSASLGTAYVQIQPKATGISGSISKLIGGEASSAGTKAGLGISNNIKKAIATAGIGVALGKSLSEGAKLQQSYYGGLDTLYGDAAEKAREYARAAVQAGVSQNAFSEQAVSFGAALRQAYGGDTTKALESANMAILDMTDNAAKMGTPLQSIQDAYQGFAKQNYTMLDNLKLGYGGTKTEMERLLSDAEKLSGQEYDISNLGDVYEAIHVIQGELGLTGVAAQEASETFSGSLAAMKAAGQNLLGNLMLGENIAPAMQDLVTTSTTFLFNNLLPAVGQIFASLPTAIGTAISTGLPIIGEKAGELITALTDGINTKIPELAESLPGAVNSALQNISASLPTIMAKGGELIKNLGTAIITNAPQLAASAGEAISSFVGFLERNLPMIATKGGEIIGKLAKGIITHLPQIVAAVAKIGLFIVKNLARIAVTVVKSGFNVAKGIANGIKSGVGSLIGKAMDAIKDKMSEKMEAAKEKVSSIIKKIKGFFPLSIGKIFSNLKLPHFNVSGGSAPFGIGGLGTKPSISVSWYKKAEETPYLFNGATLFGAGEANDEVLYGRSALKRDISEAVGNGGVTNITNYITVDGAENPEQFATRFIRQMRLETRMA